MMNTLSYLPANWPQKPSNVHALTTLRAGGVSEGGFSEYNLATHVGDELSAVKKNREKLVKDLQLPAEPVWLDQVHSNTVIRLDAFSGQAAPKRADASVSSERNVVCAVLTADCLPVFFSNEAGTEVAVAHAGWRGLHAGILSNTVESMRSAANQILVSLGPAIGPTSFEVGEEVFSAFIDKDVNNKQAFKNNREGHYFCDIYQLAHLELAAAGIIHIAGGGYCTYRESQRFYSYRKQSQTGRMASLIWFD